MSKEQWSDVDRYLTDLLVQPDVALETALAMSVTAGLPAINVAPNQGKLLMMLAKFGGARQILEIGTLGGYSTIWLARALPAEDADARVVTLEVEPKHADVARTNLRNAGLLERVEIRLGLAAKSLEELSVEKRSPFDFIFIDADKVSTPEYFQWAVTLSRPGTLIVIDNVIRNGAVADSASTDVSVLGVRRALDMMAADSRVTPTAIQTVGSKGYDGLAMAIVL